MLEKLKKEVLDANLALVEYGLVTFTWGNVSGIDREKGLIVIKPSGLEYSKMKFEDMVVVDMEGNIVEGNYRASSDTPTHIVLYKAFSEIKGIVHTHSKYATSWAQASKDIPVYGTTHADYFYGPIPCTRDLSKEEICSKYEEETGNVIVEAFDKRDIEASAVPGVIVSGHGPFTWGSSSKNAVHNAVVMEEISKMALYTLQINQSSTTISTVLQDKHYSRKHGDRAYYGQNNDLKNE